MRGETATLDGSGSEDLDGNELSFQFGVRGKNLFEKKAVSKTVRLPRNERHQFRYLVNRETWVTDEESDGLVENEFGGRNGVGRVRSRLHRVDV